MASVTMDLTARWEEKSFIREGEAAGIVANMQLAWSYDHRYAVYWREALYVHCEGNFVMRISLSNGKYQVIKPPHIELIRLSDLYLGKSENGVWILNESHGQIEWVLKHHSWLTPRQSLQQIEGPWMLQDINYHKYGCEECGIGPEDVTSEVVVEQKFEWDSDDDNVIDANGWGDNDYGGYFSFLGFHPQKEVVFLSETLSRGWAYHLNSSKIQDIGNLSPKFYNEIAMHQFVESSFPYTPCWMEFLDNN
uniref:Uncharacterized protein n=1 Tax=Leersia perrieri TaxID=77586 RepID=A0A0D9VV83_9ORYZ